MREERNSSESPSSSSSSTEKYEKPIEEVQDNNRPSAMLRLPSLKAECNDLKLKFENCFDTWYTSKFLPSAQRQESKTTDDSSSSSMALVQDECRSLFNLYRDCVKVGLKERKLENSIPIETFSSSEKR